MLRTLHLFFFIGIFFCGNAQVKYERESRIKPDQVPKAALNYLKNVPFENRVKWFEEESFNGRSYEAKARIRGKEHSIEFDTVGILQDVEITIKFDEIPENTRTKIRSYLGERYNKVRFQRVQRQWSGDSDLVQKYLLTGQTSDTLLLRYEIVARVNEDKLHKLYEYLFSAEGEIVKRDEIIPRNTDNLDF